MDDRDAFRRHRAEQHMGLQQFFKWLMLDEQEIDRSPMERIRQPRPPKKLIPVIRDDDTSRVLKTCKGKEFAQLRDETIIRLYYTACPKWDGAAG